MGNIALSVNFFQGDCLVARKDYDLPGGSSFTDWYTQIFDLYGYSSGGPDIMNNAELICANKVNIFLRIAFAAAQVGYWANASATGDLKVRGTNDRSLVASNSKSSFPVLMQLGPGMRYASGATEWNQGGIIYSVSAENSFIIQAVNLILPSRFITVEANITNP